MRALFSLLYRSAVSVKLDPEKGIALAGQLDMASLMGLVAVKPAHGSPLAIDQDTLIDAADTQRAALGSAVRGVFVAHPIQDRTDEEMAALADGAVDDLIAALTGGPSPSPAP